MNGFILSHHWQDEPDGICFHYWVATDEGARCLIIEGQELVAFAPADQQDLLPNWPDLRVAPLTLKHFNQQDVVGVYCRYYRTLQNLKRHCISFDIPLWEADIKPVDRFMMERFVKGSLSFDIDDVSDPLHTSPKSIKPSDYWPNLKCLSVDIETSMPTKEQPEQLYSIGFVGEYNGVQQKRVFMLMEHVDTCPQWLTPCASVGDLLDQATSWLLRFDPDVIMGWNVVNFDITVLARIFKEQGRSFNWGRGDHPIRLRHGQNNFTFVDIPGRVIVDGIDSLKSATLHFESYALQHVSEQLLGKGKALKQEQINNRGEAITDLFLSDPIALAEYNVQDCQLVLDIFEKTQLLPFLIQRSQLTGHTLDRFGGSVAAFEYLYLPRLHRSGYIAPNLGDGFDDIKAPGGFVMDSQPGMYDHVLVLDFKSLYPSIIRTFKIDPMGLIEGINSKQNDESVAGFNGARFHRSHHFLPAIIEELWAARDQAKLQNNAAASQAIKIIMNSFYGVLGSTGCRFYDTRLSSSITQRGHQIIQQTAQWIEQQGYSVIYGDTDSVFVWLKNKVAGDQARDVGNTLAQDLNKKWKAYIQQHHKVPSNLELEFETHYERFLMPTIRGSELGSKKRYAGLTDQGVMQFKGLEAVRSDWTALARTFQTELYRRVFHNEPYEAFIVETAENVLQGLRDKELIYRKRIRRPLHEYVKNVPPQVQAARIAHQHYLETGLPSPFERGGWIEYIITLNGPEPFEFQKSPIDYHHYLDKQIAPVVDSILYFSGQSFGQLTNPQQDFFDH